MGLLFELICGDIGGDSDCGELSSILTSSSLPSPFMYAAKPPSDDPLSDISCLHAPEALIRAGDWLSAEDLMALRDSARHHNLERTQENADASWDQRIKLSQRTAEANKAVKDGSQELRSSTG